MTTNQTIDGVPRELAESIVRMLQAGGAWDTAEQLRALLDAPYPSEAQLIAAGLGYPISKEDAVKAYKASLVPRTDSSSNADCEWCHGCGHDPYGEPCVGCCTPAAQAQCDPRNASTFKLCPRCANNGRSDDFSECQGRVAWYSKPPNKAFTEWYCRNPYEQLTNATVAWMAFKAGRDHASVVSPAEQPAPVAVVMSFDFEHPSSKERRTVALSKQDVFDGMEDYFYDKICEQICRCESVGETNVVDCSCDEYVHDFEIVKASLTS